MAKITFADKVTLNENQSVADINKGRSADWNEVKSVVNTNDDIVTNILTYSSNETNTNMVWIDGKPIYRKVFTLGSVSTLNTDLSFSADITDVETVVDFRGLVYFEDYAVPWNFYNWANQNFAYISFYRSGSIYYRIGRAISSASFIIEYTKTTD